MNPRTPKPAAPRRSPVGEPRPLALHLPMQTALRIGLSLLGGWALLRLWPEFVLLLFAVVLAVALYPIVTWLERKKVSRGAAIGLIALGLLVVIVGLLALVTTSLAEQMSRLIQDFPDFRARVEQRIPASYPILRRIVAEIFALPRSPELASQLQRPLALGTSVLAVALSMLFTMVITVYLLLDGKRLYAWLIAYVPRKHRDDVAVTAAEVSVVVHAYVRGQVITSVLFTLFAAVVLTVFKVPAALPLAVVAGVCDVIPVIGAAIATVPAVLLAFSVSLTAGLGVTALYVIYHFMNSYYIVPRIYGTRLRLSTLAVLLALMLGTALQGLIGAILVLPLVAAYPIIERIWLVRYLNPEVIHDHGALANVAELENEEAVVETVLQGEQHAWEAGAQGKALEREPGHLRDDASDRDRSKP
jgi:predicted PurR-regulated permease PerM